MNNEMVKWLLMVIRSLRHGDMKNRKIHITVRVGDEANFSHIFDGSEVYEE